MSSKNQVSECDSSLRLINSLRRSSRTRCDHDCAASAIDESIYRFSATTWPTWFAATSYGSLLYVMGTEAQSSGWHESPAANQTLEPMTRSAVTFPFQIERLWRAPRHGSALRWPDELACACVT